MSHERLSSSLVIPSIAIATAAERSHLQDQTAIERDWYQGVARYSTNQAILEAARPQKLVKVTGDANLAPIGRLRNERLHDRFPPFTGFDTLAAMRKIGVLWRQELPKLGQSEAETGNIRLAVTSLTRSEETQAKLVEDPDKLAVPISSHCAGGAFDIDASGYYVVDNNDSLVPIQHPARDRDAVAAISQTLQSVDTNPYAMPVADEPYRPEVSQALITVCERLQATGAINHIVEFEGTSNQCVHVAVNPELDGYDWAHL